MEIDYKTKGRARTLAVLKLIYVEKKAKSDVQVGVTGSEVHKKIAEFYPNEAVCSKNVIFVHLTRLVDDEYLVNRAGSSYTPTDKEFTAGKRGRKPGAGNSLGKNKYYRLIEKFGSMTFEESCDKLWFDCRTELTDNTVYQGLQLQVRLGNLTKSSDGKYSVVEEDLI